MSEAVKIRERLAKERGRIDKRAPFTIALSYPSPYGAAMSSLGYQQIYRLIQGAPSVACERTFLADDVRDRKRAPKSYESGRVLSDFPVIAFSVAYELELAGVVEMLESSGIPSLREARDASFPLVIAGGPLSFSNPLPLAAFVDAIIVGEAEDLIEPVLAALEGACDKAQALSRLAAIPHVFVPEAHGALLPVVAKCRDDQLPAHSTIITPDTELSGMFLIETERGCSRACSYCVMRRSTNGGMRIVKKERLLELIPEDARKVGLVGAAVSDHPKIVEIVQELAARGADVGLSSLRPDRLSTAFVGALAQAGYRTLTTAMDGPSERLREALERRARVKHLVRAAELAREHGMKRLKLYLMLGLPGETDEDVAECVSFVSELAKVVPIALGIAPFCAKRNTPLDGAPFAGIDVVDHRLALLRQGLRGRAEVRATSARWAWVEYVLAQGGVNEGRAVREAVLAGGGFVQYKRAFEQALSSRPGRRTLAIAPH